MGVKVRFWKGAWWVFVNVGRRRKAKRIGDKETAVCVAKSIREKLVRGEFGLETATEDETIETYARRWLSAISGNLKASTIRFYSENLDRHVFPLFGSRPVRSITRADCKDLITACRGRGLKLNTVKGIARTLSTVLSAAVEDEKLPANPALRMGRYLRRGDEPETEIQPLNCDESAHLVQTAIAHFPRWAPWVLCALRTGLRMAELIALQWGDIDWLGRFVVVQRNIVKGVATTPKSHQRRRVDLSAQLLESLLAWRRTQRERWLKKGQDLPVWVFPSREGTALEERNVRYVFTRMLEKAELRQIRVHDLRHSFATLLLQAGAPITYVSQQLGHADASITLRVYAHYLPDASRKEVDLLDTQPVATPAQPEPGEDSATLSEMQELFGKTGEPRRNRTSRICGRPSVSSSGDRDRTERTRSTNLSCASGLPSSVGSSAVALSSDVRCADVASFFNSSSCSLASAIASAGLWRARDPSGASPNVSRNAFDGQCTPASTRRRRRECARRRRGTPAARGRRGSS